LPKAKTFESLAMIRRMGFHFMEDVAEVVDEAVLRGIFDGTSSDAGTWIGKRILGLAILLKEIGNRPVNFFIHPDQARLSTLWLMF